jgi:hypothetical protein
MGGVLEGERGEYGLGRVLFLAVKNVGESDLA